jgi:hypothetical protein
VATEKSLEPHSEVARIFRSCATAIVLPGLAERGAGVSLLRRCLVRCSRQPGEQEGKRAKTKGSKRYAPLCGLDIRQADVGPAAGGRPAAEGFARGCLRNIWGSRKRLKSNVSNSNLASDRLADGFFTARLDAGTSGVWVATGAGMPISPARGNKPFDARS